MMFKNFKQTFWPILVLCVSIFMLSGEFANAKEGSPNDFLSFNNADSNEILPPGNNKKNEIYKLKENNHDKKLKETDFIELPDPYKTMLKSTTRFAIDMSPLTRYVSTDAVMNFLTKFAHKLAKKTVLIIALKLLAFSVSAISISLYLFPQSLITIDNTLRQNRNRIAQIDQLLRTSFHPDAIVDHITRTSDMAMDQIIGITDDRGCRERSICEIGDILACSFPSFVSQAKQLATENLPEIDVDRNKYARALTAGLQRKDCANMYQSISTTCPSISEFINKYFWGNSPRGLRKK